MPIEAVVGATGAAVLNAAGWAVGKLGDTQSFKDWLADCKKRLAAGRVQIHNHDLVRGIRMAHLCALDRIARRHRELLKVKVETDTVGSDEFSFSSNLESFLHGRLTLLNEKGIDHDVLTIGDIAHVLDEIVSSRVPKGYAEQYAVAREEATKNALTELERDAGRRAPTLFREVFLGVHGPGWYDCFALWITEELKINERFRSIFFAEELVDIKRTIAVLDELMRDMAQTLPLLGEFIDEARTRFHRVEGNLDRVGAAIDSLPNIIVQRLLSELNARGETAAARNAGIRLDAVVALAQQINREVTDFDQALVELQRAVRVAIEVAEQAQRKTNLGAFVDDVLARIAKKSARGEFEAASTEAETAFAEWEQEEADRRGTARQAGIVLLEAGLKQDVLRRDPVSAAKRLERIVTLEQPDHSARFAALRIMQNEWYNRGHERGVNFDLAVAIETAKITMSYAVGPNEVGLTYNDLGAALAALGEREGDSLRLENASDAFRASLRVRTRELAPRDWAVSQVNLANIFARLGMREGNTSRLYEAVSAYRAALNEIPREHMPLVWGVTHNSLGATLAKVGELEGSTNLLQEAVFAHRAALEVLTRVRAPLDWAGAQNNLAIALRMIGERKGDNALLEEAVTAYRASLLERTRERTPLDWALTQNNLGSVLGVLGQRTGKSALFQDAITAHQSALLEITRERAPLDWALTQNNLGNSLGQLGILEKNSTRLEEAIKAFRAALLERTRERAPLDWALTQNNIGNLQRMRGILEPNIACLREATIAYRAALLEISRARMPTLWATIQNGIGLVLGMTALLEKDVACAKSARLAFRAAQQESGSNNPTEWRAMVQKNLARAEETLKLIRRER